MGQLTPRSLMESLQYMHYQIQCTKGHCRIVLLVCSFASHQPTVLGCGFYFILPKKNPNYYDSLEEQAANSVVD